MDNIEDKIAKASNSTSARFKRKKIRSMKREATNVSVNSNWVHPPPRATPGD